MLGETGAEIIQAPIETVATGFTLTEGPRWRDGRLYFSDMFANRVCAVGETGTVQTIARFDEKPSGLGFLPDGDMLIVLMLSQKLVRRDRSGTIHAYADLSPFATVEINDMAVAPDGRAYVGQFGYAYAKGEPRKTTCIVAVEPDGRARVAADGLWGPNGIALSEDGKTLFTAEASGWQISAFDVARNGDLSNQRVVMTHEPKWAPDGICLDAQGGIWAGIPVAMEGERMWGPGFVRFGAHGKPTHILPVGEGRRAIACAFGGPGRKTLYLCTTDTFDHEAALTQRGARIERADVGFSGAGVP